MGLFKRQGGNVATSGAQTSDDGEISDGSLKYVGEKGRNNTTRTYQEASGAPVESDSPLGYSVGPITITLLNWLGPTQLHLLDLGFLSRAAHPDHMTCGC